jgi:imidazolonepropionase
MEARALARTGDATACDRAIGAAVDHFDHHTPGDGPEWIGYFDGAELAAEIGALSADHLAVPSEAGIDALAAAAASGSPVVAVVLPATTWFLMHDELAPARTFIERGIPVALATDFNPGTSPTASLPFVMTVACVELQLSPSEALAAVTVNAAAALGLGDEIGSIETGRQADLAIWNVPTHRQIPYWPAADLVRAVVKKGSVVLERAPA